ncbi:hypothetical protein HHI36_005173 [Cryptolaemus montrouzieri]|uniref:Carboxylesterase type B domain-containing protein n=1 Tax=Cryptolaemus montrouzieri TaxID=559131 RepID=A0ABD2NTK0_9CUCU
MMYGVTEVESINFLGPIALTYGMLQKERDQELRNYLRFTCETKPELCVSTILEEYTGNIFIMDDEAYSSTVTNTAGVVRDSLLDILSDARTVAPILKMGLFHSMVNRHSYFYVFTHKTESKDHLLNKTSTGDELAYVFGVPLGGSSFHFVDRYTEREALFSEVIMTYICNFAYRGNPNRARKLENYSLGQFDWTQYDVDWPEFGSKQQYYLQLGK